MTLLTLGVGGYVLVDRLAAEAPTDVVADETTAAPPAFGAPADDAPAQGSGTGAAPQSSGPAVALRPVSVTATCQAPPGIDAANNPITYEPQRTLDGRPDTAWRCEGSAIGARLVYEFGGPVTIASVGLIPGYAKIDPTDGSDRFLENFTVTAVEWSFDDGLSHPQRIPSPTPVLTVSDLPAGTATTRVVLEITATGNAGAEREFTAISDVAFTGYAAGTP